LYRTSALRIFRTFESSGKAYAVVTAYGIDDPNNDEIAMSGQLKHETKFRASLQNQWLSFRQQGEWKNNSLGLLVAQKIA
jgi:hypothetical protein